ncbi:hypothetical protein NE865_10365 [Phthorimaea operculella]|nr:hypothetical protein NE865_10365 [Phthorimaea operculella]
MPRKYVRKEGVVPRVIEWTENDLKLAFEDIEKGDKGINEIARSRGIPCRTLRRRFMKRSIEKQTLGKHPLFGFENKARLVKHLLKLGEAGFPPDRKSIRLLAYNFAENLGLNHNFDSETEMAGHAWFNNFMERHPELSIRQAEGLSMARAKGLSREEVADFFTLLRKL